MFISMFTKCEMEVYETLAAVCIERRETLYDGGRKSSLLQLRASVEQELHVVHVMDQLNLKGDTQCAGGTVDASCITLSSLTDKGEWWNANLGLRYRRLIRMPRGSLTSLQREYLQEYELASASERKVTSSSSSGLSSVAVDCCQLSSIAIDC